MSSEMVQVDAARLQKLEEMERKQKLSARKAAIKVQLYVEKAKDCGIKVTKSEIDARLLALDAKDIEASTDAGMEGV